jgi:hypothetical protein
MRGISLAAGLIASGFILALVGLQLAAITGLVETKPSPLTGTVDLPHRKSGALFQRSMRHTLRNDRRSSAPQIAAHSTLHYGRVIH